MNALILAQRAYAYLVSPRSRTNPDSTGPYTLNALEDFGRAAYHQPRYPVARYRRAVALSSLMDEGVNIDKVFLPPGGGAGPDTPSRSRLLHLFRDLLGYGSGEDQLGRWIDLAVKRREFPLEMRCAMLELAYAWLVDAERSVNAGRLAQLRPSERRFWHEFNRAGTKRDWTMLVRVSQQIVRVRLAHTRPPYTDGVSPIPPDIVERALQARSHWQISYNIACYHSLLAANATDQNDVKRHREQAFDWLERCLDRPFSGQLVREWIDRDPDLAGVRPLDVRPVAGKDAASWSRWRLRVPPMPVQIRFGDRSSAVEHLQRGLNKLHVTDRRLKDDGEFGEETLEAVKKFQFQHDLRVTGSPDLTMLALLETLAEERSNRTSGPRRNDTDRGGLSEFLRRAGRRLHGAS